MKKIVITGGDNGYCCRCGGLCDRVVMEEDTDAKTLKYIDGRGLCLGCYCWRAYTCEDGTELVRELRYTRSGVRAKVRAYRNGEELPCVVRNNKWGKDGEFGARGCAWRKREEGANYWVLIDRADWDEQKKETGWKLLAR